MTANEFNALCGRYLIDPDLALENDLVRKALAEQDNEAVEYHIKNNF